MGYPLYVLIKEIKKDVRKDFRCVHCNCRKKQETLRTLPGLLHTIFTVHVHWPNTVETNDFWRHSLEKNKLLLTVTYLLVCVKR